MIAIPDIVENTLSKIDFGGNVLDVVYDPSSNTSVISVCELYFAREHLIVSIDGVEPSILEVNRAANTFTVFGDFSGAENWSLPLNYFHGTPYLASDEIDNSIEQYPLCYLYEIIRERINNPSSGIEREAEIRLFFLDLREPSWRTNELYQARLYGLVETAMRVIREFQKRAEFYTEDVDFEMTNYPKWGEFRTMMGVTNSVFSAETSGVELKFDLKLFPNCLNNNCL